MDDLRELPTFALGGTGNPAPDPLDALRRAILMHPAAARALFASLVAEGRRFGATREGRSLRRRLEASPGVARLQGVFDSATLRLLQEEPGNILPSTLFDALCMRAAQVPGTPPPEEQDHA